MKQIQYILTYGNKRQEAVNGRADCGPIIPVGFADSVNRHVPKADREGAKK
jgi:hypothetical protein